MGKVSRCILPLAMAALFACAERAPTKAEAPVRAAKLTVSAEKAGDGAGQRPNFAGVILDPVRQGNLTVSSQRAGGPLVRGAVDFTTIDGFFGCTAIEVAAPRLFLLADGAGFVNFWGQLQSCVFPSAPAPDIDFTEHMVVALVDEVRSSGGYTIQIDRVRGEDQRLVVEATQTSPCPGCFVTFAITQPVHLIVLPKLSFANIELELTQVISEGF